MAAALPRFFIRRRVTERATKKRCPCTNLDGTQFPAVLLDGVHPGEFELPTAGDVEWLLFSYT